MKFKLPITEGNYDSPIRYGGRLSKILSCFSLIFFKLLFSIPIIGKWFLSKEILLQTYIISCRNQQNLEKLFNILIQVIDSPIFKKSNKIHRWWFYLRMTISILQEQQIRYLLVYPDIEMNLINIASKVLHPIVGYDASYSFVSFALWEFEKGNVYNAIEFIKVAQKADPKWAYPEYLYGWFGLFVEDVDSIEHFKRAVQIDWSFLRRIKKDRSCQKFPEIIKAVSKDVLVNSDTKFVKF